VRWSGAAAVAAGKTCPFQLRPHPIFSCFGFLSYQWVVDSRYKNGKVDGPVIGPWVGSTWHFNECLKSPRFEDYRLTYTVTNRFSYLGFGRTEGELRGADLATHLGEPGV